jgi:hypothetical protein
MKCLKKDNNTHCRNNCVKQESNISGHAPPPKKVVDLEGTVGQHKDSIWLINSHKSDPAFTLSLAMPSSISLQVIVSSAPPGWTSSYPAVAPFEQMMHVSAAKVEDVVVVHARLSSNDIVVGAGVSSSSGGQQYSASMSYSAHAFDPDSNRVAPSMSSLHVEVFPLYSGT